MRGKIRVPRPDTEISRLTDKLRSVGYNTHQISGYLGIVPKTLLRYERGISDMRWIDYERLVALVEEAKKDGTAHPLTPMPTRLRQPGRRRKPTADSPSWSELLASLGGQ